MVFCNGRKGMVFFEIIGSLQGAYLEHSLRLCVKKWGEKPVRERGEAATP